MLAHRTLILGVVHLPSHCVILFRTTYSQFWSIHHLSLPRCCIFSEGGRCMLPHRAVILAVVHLPSHCYILLRTTYLFSFGAYTTHPCLDILSFQRAADVCCPIERLFLPYLPSHGVILFRSTYQPWADSVLEHTPTRDEHGQVGRVSGGAPSLRCLLLPV